MFLKKSPIKKLAIMFIFSGLIHACGKQKDQNISLVQSLGDPISYPKGWGNGQLHIQLSQKVFQESEEMNREYGLSDIVPQIQAAMDTWNAAIGRVILVLDNTVSQTDTNLLQGCREFSLREYFPLCDSSSNTIFYEEQDPQYPETSGWWMNTNQSSLTLASTIFRANAEGYLVNTDLHLNRDNYVFGDSLLDNNSLFNQDHALKAASQFNDHGKIKKFEDLRSVILHELGHSLGLGHDNCNKNSIMYPAFEQIGFGQTKRTLSRDDINRIRSIYDGEKLTSSCTQKYP